MRVWLYTYIYVLKYVTHVCLDFFLHLSSFSKDPPRSRATTPRRAAPPRPWPWPPGPSGTRSTARAWPLGLQGYPPAKRGTHLYVYVYIYRHVFMYIYIEMYIAYCMLHITSYILRTTSYTVYRICYAVFVHVSICLLGPFFTYVVSSCCLQIYTHCICALYYTLLNMYTLHIHTHFSCVHICLCIYISIYKYIDRYVYVCRHGQGDPDLGSKSPTTAVGLVEGPLAAASTS